MLTDFQNSFTVRLRGKFATKLYLNICRTFILKGGTYVMDVTRHVGLWGRA